MPAISAAPRWLSAADVAAREGISVAALRSRIGRATFPAPAKFTKGEAMWDARDLDAHAAGEHPAFWDLAGLSREDSSRVLWARLLDEVRWWVWKNGDANVPISAVGRGVGVQAARLGPRVSALRSLRRQGGLPASVAAEFTRLPGWSWNVADERWRARLDDVLTRWPTRLTSEDRRWLGLQRGKVDTLPRERVAAMEAVPGLMGYQGNRRVAEFVEAVTAWLSEHPGATTQEMGHGATVKVRGQEVRVGKKAGYYRRRYLGKEARQPLTSEEIAALEALPGWSWEQSARHVHAASKARGASRRASRRGSRRGKVRS